MPLPLPTPPRTNKGPTPSPAVAAPVVKHSSSADPKLQAVKVYRKALGLCYKCGAKWSKDHTCPPEVLPVVEALWDSFDNSEDGCSEHQDKPVTEQLLVAISKAAALGACAARTIWFSGTIAGHPMLILIDSGSSSSFLSESLAAQLSSAVLTPQSTQVQVAGGGLLLSSGILRNVSWTLDQCTFHSYFRVLPLMAFDAIMGMDRLAAFSPMYVHL